jgi:ribokinase
VTVLGSVNLDLVVHTPQRPGPGQTVLGTNYSEVVGGKGLNQAVASARTTATSLVAVVGTDDAGDRVRQYLQDRAVDTSAVQRVPGPTGRAVIVVTPDGENSIVVAPLANARLERHAVEGELDRLRPSVLLVQREIPVPVLLASMTWARSHGTRVIYNPSPVEGVEPHELGLAQVLVVNLHEARALTGQHEAPPGPELARDVASRGRSAVLTAGARGIWVAESGRDPVHVPATPAVTAVDSTGAGDEFAGALAAAVAHGAMLAEATRVAAAAAGRIVAIPRDGR